MDKQVSTLEGMVKQLFFVFFSVTVFSLSAQDHGFNLVNLAVSEGELTANTYSLDSTANAFYIYEKGFSRFENGNDYNLLTDYSAKIKILNTEGYDAAEVEIPLYKNKNNTEKIRKLIATTTYLENGERKVATLEPSRIYREEREDFDVVKFTFPGITPGAVLVYTYTKESPFYFNFETWWFQDDIPKVYSSFETKIPANYKYHIKKVGELELEINTLEVERRCFMPEGASVEGDCYVAYYAMRNIPAFVEESYLTSRLNFISRIDYELSDITRLDGVVKKFTKSWKDVDKELKDEPSIGKQLKRTSLVADILPEQISAQPYSLEKAQEIYRFVKENYRWNGEYHLFRELNLKDLLKEKSGNASSINILLHNIYEQQGFKVLPVLGATRSRGVPTQVYPVLSEFNILMVQLEVEQQKFLLDATEKNLDFGELPFRNLNDYARLLDFDNGSSWIDLEPTNFSGIMISDTLTVTKNGTTTGNSSQVFTGYHALRLRDELEDFSGTDILNVVSNPGEHTKSVDTRIKNQELASEPLFIDFTLANDSQKINDAIYLNPFSFKFFTKNPFQLKERHYPIDFGYKDTYTYQVTIEIPENHTVAELPEQKIMHLPEKGGSIQLFVQQPDERHVRVHCRISFPKISYPSGYYPYLKEFFNTILEVQSHSLIVIKEII